jgi:hypothetical protein
MGIGRPGTEGYPRDIKEEYSGTYARDKVISTCEMSLTFTTSVDFIPVEVREILETLFGMISAPGGHDAGL